MTSDKKVIEIGNIEELPPFYESFAVGELSIALEDGVSEAEVNSSILRALGHRRSTEDDELSAFGETIRSKLLNVMQSVHLPVVEGTLEITNLPPTPLNKSSDNNDDGYITISRNCARYSSDLENDILMADMTIPVKNTRQSDEVSLLKNEYPVPRVTNIIVFDANEEGVRTMKEVLLEQINAEQGVTQLSPTDIPCTVILHESGNPRYDSGNITELVTAGIHDLKLTTPKSLTPLPLNNSKQMLSVGDTMRIKKSIDRHLAFSFKKSAPKKILLAKPKIHTRGDVSAVCGIYRKLLSLSDRPIARPVNNKGMVSIVKTHTNRWHRYCIKSRVSHKKGSENCIIVTKESKEDSVNSNDNVEDLTQVIQLPSTTVKTTRVQPMDSPIMQDKEGNNRVEDSSEDKDCGLGFYVSISSSNGSDVETHSVEVSKQAADSTTTALDPNLAKGTEDLLGSAASTDTGGAGCHKTGGVKEVGELVDQKDSAKSSDTNGDEKNTDRAVVVGSHARNDGNSIPDYRDEWKFMRPALEVHHTASNPLNNAAVPVEPNKDSFEIDLANAEVIIDGVPSRIVEDDDPVDVARLPANELDLVYVDDMEPNAVLAEEVDPLSIADVGDAACNNEPDMVCGDEVEPNTALAEEMDSSIADVGYAPCNSEPDLVCVDYVEPNAAFAEEMDSSIGDVGDAACNNEPDLVCVDEMEPNTALAEEMDPLSIAVVGKGPRSDEPDLVCVDDVEPNIASAEEMGLLSVADVGDAPCNYEPDLVCVDDVEPNTALAEELDPLSVADVGDAPCNDSVDNNILSILDDAALQKMYHPDTDDGDQHLEFGCKLVHDSCLQTEVVDNESSFDFMCLTEAPISGQVEMSRNPDLDIDQPNIPVPSASDYGLCLVPKHMIHRGRKTYGPHRFKWVPPMIFPDHDYVHKTGKTDRKRQFSIQLKQCSVVLNRLSPSVLEQYDSSSDSSEEVEDNVVIPADNFICSHCSVEYPSLEVLGEHIALEHADSMFTCTQCNGQFASILDCNDHIGVCDYVGESRSSHITYLCPQCDFSTNDDSELRGHIDTEHRVLCSHCCPFCPFKCIAKSTLVAHTARYHQLITNSNSPASDSRPSTLIPTANMNEKIHEPVENNRDKCNTTCNFCRFKCMSEFSLKNHMNRYHAISTVDEATRASVLNSSIQSAMDFIEAEFQHECIKCSYKTETEAALTVHMKYFHDIVPNVDDESLSEHDYLCIRCVFKCKREIEIREHNKTVHGVSYHRCYKCSHNARTEAELLMHMRYFHNLTPKLMSHEPSVELNEAVHHAAYSKTVSANKQQLVSSLQPKTSNTTARNTVVVHNPQYSTTHMTNFLKPLRKFYQDINLTQQTEEVTSVHPLQRISLRQPSELLKPDLIPQQEPTLLPQLPTTQLPVSEPPSQPSASQLPEHSEPPIVWQLREHVNPDLVLQQQPKVLPHPQLPLPQPSRFQFQPRCTVRQPKSLAVVNGQEKNRVKCIFPSSRPGNQFMQFPGPRLPDPAQKSRKKSDAQTGTKNQPSTDHLASESGEIECPECYKTFKTYAALGHHIVKLHSKKKKVPILQRCPLCDKTFSTKMSLERHIGNKHGVRCPDCSVYFSRKEIQRHMVNTHRSECFVCQCNFVATVDSVMQLHKMIEHRLLLDKDVITCPVCPPHTTKFKTLSHLDEHANQRHYFLFKPYVGKINERST